MPGSIKGLSFLLLVTLLVSCSSQMRPVAYKNWGDDLSFPQPVANFSKYNEVIRSSAHLDIRILNQSHLSLINSPNNALYGRDGVQLVCNGNEYPIFRACMRARNHWFGAQHTPSPDGVAVARTAYNLDFATVVEMFEEVFVLE